MNAQEFFQKYGIWCHRNGITQTPTFVVGSGTPTQDFHPANEAVWNSPSGSRMIQGLDVLMTFPDPFQGIVEVRRFYGYSDPEGGTAVSWKDFLNPPPVKPDAPKPAVGPEVPTEIVKAFSPSGRVSPQFHYFRMGGLDIPEHSVYTAPDGKKYLSVNPGSPFEHWLLLLA